MTFVIQAYGNQCYQKLLQIFLNYDRVKWELFRGRICLMTVLNTSIEKVFSMQYYFYSEKVFFLPYNHLHSHYIHKYLRCQEKYLTIHYLYNFC